VIREIIFKESQDKAFGLGLLIILLPLFVFLSYPIHYSVYKSLNNDLQERLGSINETTTTDSTIQQGQQGQQLTQQQPTTLDLDTVEFASHAELPCSVPIVQQFACGNTAAERVGKS
jgi:hypothetical protein